MLEMKWIALLVLIVQNSSQVIIMRYSRLSPGDDGKAYLASTAVLCSEVIKLFVAILTLIISEGWQSTRSMISRDIINNKWDTLKLGIPALIYTLQNNLLYMALSNLDPAIFQVSYQLKVLTTALSSVLMLRTRLSMQQWMSLVVLMGGVIIVQLAQEEGGKVAAAANQPEQNTFVGLMCVLIACIFSGFAGVYFEKVLKESTTNLWIRNLQLAAFSIILSTITVITQDGDKLRDGGFFQGYNGWTISAILMQVFGGLLVAVVVKYADNILKGFATSVAIVVSCILSAFFFDFKISLMFASGALLVVVAVFIYGVYPPSKVKVDLKNVQPISLNALVTDTDLEMAAAKRQD